MYVHGWSMGLGTFKSSLLMEHNLMLSVVLEPKCDTCPSIRSLIHEKNNVLRGSNYRIGPIK